MIYVPRSTSRIIGRFVGRKHQHDMNFSNAGKPSSATLVFGDFTLSVAPVYFAMADAMSAVDGRAHSDRDLAVAEDLCRALEQEALTAEELHAVERLVPRKGAFRRPQS